MIAKRNFIQEERERNGAFDGKRPRQAKTARFLPEAQGTKADEGKTRRSLSGHASRYLFHIFDKVSMIFYHGYKTFAARLVRRRERGGCSG